jgi:hypothetical protein
MTKLRWRFTSRENADKWTANVDSGWWASIEGLPGKYTLETSDTKYIHTYMSLGTAQEIANVRARLWEIDHEQRNLASDAVDEVLEPPRKRYRDQSRN